MNIFVFTFQTAMADVETAAILDISRQLDLLIVEYFQTLSDIFKCRQLLDNDVKDGFFYMAKVTINILLIQFL